MTSQIYYCSACSWPAPAGVSSRGECQQCHERLRPLEKFCAIPNGEAAKIQAKRASDIEAIRSLRASITKKDRASFEASSRAAVADAEDEPVEAMKLYLFAALRAVTSAIACLELIAKEPAGKRPSFVRCATSRARRASKSIVAALEREAKAAASTMDEGFRVVDGEAAIPSTAERPKLKVVIGGGGRGE